MATPNMNLTLPVVGVTAGPAYATQVNAALTVIDSHNHASGSGVQITPAGLNINADLSMNSNDLTDTRTVRFTAQAAALPGTTPDLACLYVVGNNLYYNDGAGNQIAMTASGSIAGASGNITGLVAPASAVYTSGGSPNFKFMSTATNSANIDGASYLMRNPGVTATYALTLQAPTLSSNYSITLPTVPASASFLQIDSSGVITASPAVSLGITAANLAADSVTTAKIADANVTGAKIASATITNSNIANSTIQVAKLAFTPTLTPTAYTSSTTYVVPTGCVAVLVSAVGGGGGGGAGGGGGGNNGGGGGGGASGCFVTELMPVVAGETLTLTIGTGGSAGAAGGGTGGSGGTGNTTSVSAGTSGWTVRALGGSGGSGGVTTTGGAGGPSYVGGGLSSGAGATGGSSSTAGGNTAASSRAAGGTGMPVSGANGGGGAGAPGYAAPGTQIAGNDGANAPANSGAGGGGGSGGNLSGQNGGSGGSGIIYLTIVPVS